MLKNINCISLLINIIDAETNLFENRDDHEAASPHKLRLSQVIGEAVSGELEEDSPGHWRAVQVTQDEQGVKVRQQRVADLQGLTRGLGHLRPDGRVLVNAVVSVVVPTKQNKAG